MTMANPQPECLPANSAGSSTACGRSCFSCFLVSLGMSCVAVRMKRARQQKAAVEEIKKLGGYVQYDYQVEQSGRSAPKSRPAGTSVAPESVGRGFLRNGC